jgi:hypothetical protein
MTTFITIAVLVICIYKLHNRLVEVDPEYKAILEKDYEPDIDKAIAEKLAKAKVLSGSVVAKIKVGISKWK